MITAATPSGLFVTQQAMVSPATLSAAWTTMFAGDTVGKDAVLQDLSALTTALGSTYYSIFPEPNSMQVCQRLTDLTAAITANPEDLKTERQNISALLGNLSPAAVVFGRAKLFGRSQEAFLSKTTLGSREELTKAWDALFEGGMGVVNNEQGAIEDLAVLAMTLGQLNYTRASYLRNYLDAALSEDTPIGIGQMQAMISSFLKRLDDQTLSSVSKKLYPRRRRAQTAKAGSGIAPRRFTPAKIMVEGKPIEAQDQGIEVYPVLKAAKERDPVKSPSAEKVAAKQNIDTAVKKYLSEDLFGKVVSLLPKHIAAIISGEIDAPLKDREAIVNFVAQSPEHAAAYGEAVLQDAIVVGALTAPISMLGDLDGLTPVAQKMPDVTKIPRAGITPGGVDELDRIAWQLYLFLSTQEPESRAIMDSLSAANPSAFAPEVLRQLVTAANVVRVLRTIKRKDERAEFVHTADVLRSIPPEMYLIMGKDPMEVEVKMPQGDDAPIDNWKDPLETYVTSDEFQSEVAMKTTASSAFPFREEFSRLIQRHGQAYGFKMSLIMSKVATRKYDEARRGIINFRVAMLKDSVEMMSEMYNLSQLDDYKSRVNAFADAGNFGHAEAMLDFIEQRVSEMINALDRSEGIADQLFITGEREAEGKFRDMMMDLLAEGRLVTLRKLNGTLFVKLKELDAPVRIRAREQALKLNITSAALLVLEGIRGLGALPDMKERVALAARAPNTLRLMEIGGPATPFYVRKLLRQLGIPVPGDDNILALGTETVGELKLPAAEQLRALTTGYDEQSSEEPAPDKSNGG
jgi:hypothetical protein